MISEIEDQEPDYSHQPYYMGTASGVRWYRVAPGRMNAGFWKPTRNGKYISNGGGVAEEVLTSLGFPLVEPQEPDSPNLVYDF